MRGGGECLASSIRLCSQRGPGDLTRLHRGKGKPPAQPRPRAGGARGPAGAPDPGWEADSCLGGADSGPDFVWGPGALCWPGADGSGGVLTASRSE